MHLTSDLKIQFLGIIPTLTDETGTLTSEEIVALAGLLSFKGKSIKKLLEETLEKGQDLKEKTKTILKNSSLRGHASIATTPVLAFSFEGSKFLDSALTGIVFSSSLMASGRRTSIQPQDIVFPSDIYYHDRAKEIYQKESTKNIACFNWLLSHNVSKDEASKILQYGLYGTGVLVLPLESIVGLVREWQREKDWMPEEVGLFLQLIKKEMPRLGVEQLFYTRLVAPRDVYPYPNIFKDPKESNLVREVKQSGTGQRKINQFSRIINCQLRVTPALREKLKRLNALTKTIAKDKEKILTDWPQSLMLSREIARDYNLAVQFQILSSVAWRVWSEKKRHRTVPQLVDSIYFCLEKAIRAFNKYHLFSRGKNKKEHFLAGEIKNLDLVFSIPPTIRQRPQFLQKYLERAADSLLCYQKLVSLGIKPRDALFVVPRALRLDVLQSYDLYNLISGYYPLRLCSTVDEQLLFLTTEEAKAIKEILREKKFPELEKAIMIKCQTTGFCPERTFCNQIKTLVKDYDEEFHQKMLNVLEEKYKDQIQNSKCKSQNDNSKFKM